MIAWTEAYEGIRSDGRGLSSAWDFASAGKEGACFVVPLDDAFQPQVASWAWSKGICSSGAKDHDALADRVGT